VIKQCFICKEIKSLDLFNRNKRTKDGKSSWCITCTKIKNKEWYAANKARKLESTRTWAQNNPDRVKKSAQKYVKKNSRKLTLNSKLRRYGITLEKYNLMIEGQKGMCAICNNVPDRLVIDHNHATGEVRQLLCVSCNAALGQVKESENIVLSMLSYLRKHSDGGKI